MKILIGHSDRKPVYLEEGDLITHLHGMGLSRSGKSMLMLYILQQLVRKKKAFCLIDPHGSLYRDLLGWLVANCYRQPLILFNPSYERRIVGLNPFMTSFKDEARIMTKAERLSQQLMKVFGLENSDQLGNIERWLRAFFYAILDRELSICDIKYFLY
jgi:DNA helicase HerA-like ATPase